SPDSLASSVSRMRPNARKISSSPNADSITPGPDSTFLTTVSPIRVGHPADDRLTGSTHRRVGAIPEFKCAANVHSVDEGSPLRSCLLSVGNMNDILAANVVAATGTSSGLGSATLLAAAQHEA